MALANAPAVAGRLDDLGDHERRAVRTVLDRLHGEVDPSPQGKRIASVRAVNLDVFTDDEAMPQWLNGIHHTTEPVAIVREALLAPGDRYDEDLARETERNLRDSGQSVLVVVVPVRAARDDTVDLVIVTRDVFSLRLHSDFEIQDGTLTRLVMRPTENNLLGLRKTVGAVFEMDQGAIAFGPFVVDPNFRGRRLRVEAFAGAVVSREGGDVEGSLSRTRVEYPLWSLSRRWGAFVELSHNDRTVRKFSGTDLLTYDAPETPGDDAIPWQFEQLDMNLDIAMTLQIGDRVHQRFTIGHRQWLRDAKPPPALEGSVREAFERDVLPRDERVSAVVARYEVFGPQYQVCRNVDSFELPEELPMGPTLSTEAELGPAFLGSRRPFVRAVTTAGWRVPLTSDGWGYAALGAAGRLEGDDLIDRELTAEASIAAPRLAGFRAVAGAKLHARAEDTSNDLFLLGGETGLRGYAVGAFAGDDLALANVELRSPPVPLWSLQMGGLVFWDVGHAADGLAELDPHHDVGIGARVLIHYLGPALLRADWAFPLSGSSAWPGRFMIGWGQVF